MIEKVCQGRIIASLLLSFSCFVLSPRSSHAEPPTESSVTAPEFSWAQRKDRILLTIELQGVKEERFLIDNNGSFVFEGIGSYRDRRETIDRYRLELDLLKGLNATDDTCNGSCVAWRMHDADSTCKVQEGAGPWEKCMIHADAYNLTHCQVNTRNIRCVLIKAATAPYWPHLLRGARKPKHMKVDWSQWLDEDKDGVRWNDDVDRPWEWWKHDDEDDDDEETEDDRRRAAALKDKFRRAKRKRKGPAAAR
jgi:hypothetical protein